MTATEQILANYTDFLKYAKSKFVLLHKSNVFLRDLHYAVMAYLSDHGIRLQYTKAESVTREVVQSLEEKGVLKKIDAQSWLLNYPDFALPRVQKTV
jgi:hypothetical protein